MSHHDETAQMMEEEGGVYTAKSFLVDLFTPDFSGVGMRQIDFYLGASKILLTDGVDFLAYDLYAAANLLPGNAFDTGTLYTGPQNTGNAFQQTLFSPAIRIAVVFTTLINFTGVAMNNAHHSGGLTSRGATDVQMYITPDVDTGLITGVTPTNGALIYDGNPRIHISSDIRDDQIIL